MKTYWIQNINYLKAATPSFPSHRQDLYLPTDKQITTTDLVTKSIIKNIWSF